MLFRKPVDNFFSIEKVFGQLDGLDDGHFRIHKVNLPHSTSSVFNMLRNLLFLRRQKADVYHITGDVHYAALALPRHRTVLTIHDCVFMLRPPGLKRSFFKWLYLDMPVRRCRLVTTISEATKQDIVKYTGCDPDKIVVIPNPPNGAIRYEPATFNQREPVILFIGSTPNKNLDRVITALRGIPCVLNIVGRIFAETLNRLESEGIVYRNSYHLTETQLADQYVQADLMLFPSTFEGFGLPVVEAQAAGRPLVTSDLSPMKDVAGAGACLVDPCDPESIRRGVLSVINDAVYRERLVADGFTNVKRFSPERATRHYKEAYQRVLGAGGSPDRPRSPGPLAALFLMVLLSLLLKANPLEAQGREEFNGPFPSWANVKARFNARGDGKHDDTKALQRAIDSLSCRPTGFNIGPQGYTVIYLPAGTYCISSTLTLRGKIGVSIIGEDPAHTVIKWTGDDRDTLLWTNGSAYFKVSRLTWDANGRKDMDGIGLHWKDIWQDKLSRSFAALNIELSDNIFIGGFKHGISGGTFGRPEGTGFNDSEVTIRRCVFYDCTGAGIEIHGYNALDYWIWDCKFLDCYQGIYCSFGGYHVYRSFFSGSRRCDLHNMHGYYLSVRGCYSQHAGAFSLDEGVSSNPFKRIFQDDVLVDPARLPIEYYHTGKLTFMGNCFTKTIDTTYNFTVNSMSWAKADYEALSMHNSYAYRDPIHITSTPAKIYSIGDTHGAVPRPSAQTFLNAMDSTPGKHERPLLDVQPGSNAQMIQAILDRAATLTGQRPIVHFGIGEYLIDRPLIVPAGADMQLVGDGLLYSSVIRYAARPATSQPVLLVKGPTGITICDLQIGAEGAADGAGIVFDNVDQPGAQAHLDQIYSHAELSLFVDRMDHLYVQKDNSFFTAGNYVAGGSLVQKGEGTARVACFGGQFTGLSVDRGGRFLAKDSWWEGTPRMPLDLAGSGSVTIDGAMIAPNGADSLPTIRIAKFNGRITLMNMYIQGALALLQDNPGLSLLGWNLHFYYKMAPLSFIRPEASYNGAFLGWSAQCFLPNNPACDVADMADRLVNVSDTSAFLEELTTADRSAEPLLLHELPKGVSNIYISRVSLGNMNRGIVFTPKQAR